MVSIERASNIIRSLSGLVNYKGLVVGVSDEYHALFVRGPNGDQLFDFSGHPLGLDYTQRKKIKFDHESISLVHNKQCDYIYTFPSLSKPNRNEIGIFQIEKNEDMLRIVSERKFNIDVLLRRLTSASELNIEGHFLAQNRLYLLNRGNQLSRNELIWFENANDWYTHSLHDNSDKDCNYHISRHYVDLGEHDGHALQWTDAVFETESTLIFLATVEKTTNAYDDGQVLASFIGRYNYQNNQVITVKKILDCKKAEGICEWNSRYLVCIDSDSPEWNNEFYSFPRTILD